MTRPPTVRPRDPLELAKWLCISDDIEKAEISGARVTHRLRDNLRDLLAHHFAREFDRDDLDAAQVARLYLMLRLQVGSATQAVRRVAEVTNAKVRSVKNRLLRARAVLERSIASVDETEVWMPELETARVLHEALAEVDTPEGRVRTPGAVRQGAAS